MLQEMILQAELLVKQSNAELQNFYTQNFSQKSLSVLSVLTEGIILKEWESKYELAFAEMLMNTSKSQLGTSAQTVCLEVIPLMSELIDNCLPQLLLKNSHCLSASEELKVYQELPQLLGVLYTAFLNLDILTNKFKFQENTETSYISILQKRTDAQAAARVEEEFHQFFSFYWNIVLAIQNCEKMTGRNYLLEFPTIILHGKAWMPDDLLTPEQKNDIMNTIELNQGRMKEVLRRATQEAEPFEKAMLQKIRNINLM